MSSSDFDSSDANRTATPLRHAQHVTFDQPMRLERGETLPAVTITYETYGTLAPQRDNVVLICHALSGDSHVARHDPDDDSGWWDPVVGPGKAIDTDRWFVICSNVLGGCRGTTGPNAINPATGRPWGADFPQITVDDMVHLQRRLIDHLGIDRLHAVIGGSLGGHQALTWAIRYPDRVANALLLAASPRLTSQALAFDIVGRNAILRDPNFQGGQYYHSPARPKVGLALARMLGHITYLSREAMSAKFDPTRLDPRDVDTDFEKDYSVGSYLAYQGHKFVERFDANSYITLSRAIDRFDLGDTVKKLRDKFRATTCRWLIVSFSSDWLFPPEQSRQMVDALVAEGKPVTYCNVESDCGHDAFLLSDDLETYGSLIDATLSVPPTSQPPCSVTGEHPGAPTSIFHGYRLDYDLILDLIPTGASVLDLGCGHGDLLDLVRRTRAPSRLVGVEIGEDAIVAAARRGLSAIHLDLEQPLTPFVDQSFDLVVLSQTLQSISDTEGVLREMLRVGRRAIVSFPNFAYHKLRRMLYEEGRSPRSQGLYHYEWYNTPNRRFPSITDVHVFCRERGIVIETEIYLDTESDQRITEDPNFHANMAIFVLSGGRRAES